MKTFDIKTDVPYSEPYSDEDPINGQHEHVWANRLFNKWFEQRGLTWLADYRLWRFQDGKVLVAFNSADEALWFKTNHAAAQ